MERNPFSVYLDSLSEQEINDHKLIAISRICGIYGFEFMNTVYFKNTVLNYEWNHSLDTFLDVCLEMILLIIDSYSSLFPVTLKLETLLREIRSRLNKFIYLHICYNMELINLCVDVGLFNQDPNDIDKCIYYTGPSTTIMRKGVIDYVYEPDRILFLYVQAVMITI
jgi:hypothetical protein